MTLIDEMNQAASQLGLPPGFAESLVEEMGEDEIERMLSELLGSQVEEDMTFEKVSTLPDMTLTITGEEYGLLSVVFTEWAMMVDNGTIPSPGEKAFNVYVALLEKINATLEDVAEKAGIDLDVVLGCNNPDCQVHNPS